MSDRSPTNWESFGRKTSVDLAARSLGDDMMAEYVGFSLHFDVPFSPESCRTFLETLRAAVLENWTAHADPLSWPAPNDSDSTYYDFAIEPILKRLDPARMKPIIPDSQVLLNSGGWIGIPFGPLSAYVGLWTLGRSDAGKLFARLSLCDSELRRSDHDRLRLRQEYEPGFADPRFLPDVPPDDAIEEGSRSYHLERLTAWLERCDAVQEENWRRTKKYHRDHQQVWAVSAACLRHIFERLVAVFPVESLRMDEEIATGRNRFA